MISPVDSLLADGSTVTIRPITPDDAERHVRFFDHLDPESKRLRFFGPHPHLTPQEVEFFTNVDGIDRVALIALRNDETIGVGRFDRTDPSSAEVAFLVSDAVQGLGIGSLLLDRLVIIAHDLGYLRFTARCLAENRKMLDVFKRSGLSAVIELQGGEYAVELYLVDLARWRAAAERRDASSVIRSLSAVLRPKAVAVIGAGRSPASVGRRIVENLLAGGYAGPIFPVNPTATEIAGLPAKATVADCQPVPDLGIIAVPAAGVLDVVDQCGAAGVQGLVIISSGFAETNDGGLELQDQIVRKAHDYGMRLVGPNCMGVINTATHLNATFASRAPVHGNIGFASQSGAVGIALLERAAQTGIGLANFTSLGNKADVSANDLLRYWAADADTKVGALYLESVGNPRAFLRIASEVSQRVPLIALKSGRSPAGQRAAASHTAAAAASDTGVNALFARAGVIRVRTLGELLDSAALFAMAPLPMGKRVAVVSNAGGAAVLAADECSDAGLEMAELPRDLLSDLAIPGLVSSANPIDLGSGADANHFGQVVRRIIEQGTVHAVIAIAAPLASAPPEKVLEILIEVAKESRKPIVVVLLGMDSTLGRAHGLPTFAFPEEAVAALARACEYSRWRSAIRPLPTAPPGIDLDAAYTIVRAGVAQGGSGWLDYDRTAALLDAYGIPTARTAVVETANEAARAASQIGYPIALKGTGRRLLHKSDRGAVLVGIASQRQLESAIRQLRQAVGDDLEAMVVQQMVEGPALEAIVGGLNDPSFGPLVMVGTGGIISDIVQDHYFAAAPLSRAECDVMIDATTIGKLADGYRGRPPVSRKALGDVLWRVGQLLGDRPEIAELDCNPVMVAATGAVVVDARVRVSDQAEIDDLLRRLH